MQPEGDSYENCKTLNECLHEWLQDPENAEAYFKVTIEEYLEDKVVDSLIRSLKQIIAAKNSVLACDDKNINRES